MSIDLVSEELTIGEIGERLSEGLSIPIKQNTFPVKMLPITASQLARSIPGNGTMRVNTMQMLVLPRSYNVLLLDFKSWLGLHKNEFIKE